MIQKCNGIKILDLEEKRKLEDVEYLVIAEKDNNFKVPVQSITDTVINSSKFKAAIGSVYESDVPTADVTLVNDKFLFSFGIPAGKKGDPGRDGIDGKDGKDGANGIDGMPGIAGNITKLVVAYKSTNSITVPDTPVGGSWDVDTDEIVYPEGWSANDINVNGYVWMSNATFSNNGNIIIPWCPPIRLTGVDGQNGTDGSNIEFVYKLTITNLVKPDPDHPTGTQQEAIKQGWTDHPSGVSEEYQCEWVSSRTKDLDTGMWSEWAPCTIWSKWGVVGQDGDGVEYIFQRTKTPIPPKDITDNNPDVDEYIPTSATGEEPWTDNPSGINITYKYEWVSKRKYRGDTKKWDNFSSPSLWARYSTDGIDGQNGLSLRVMYTRTSSSSVKPKDPDRLNINPGSIWSIAMPTAISKEAIWGIQALVTYDNQVYIDTTLPEDERGWQGPALITGVPGIDAADFNYNVDVYKQSTTKPSKPTNNDPNNPNNGWVLVPNTNEGIWWKCTGIVQSQTGTVIEWGSVIRQTGVGFTIKGTLDSYDDLPTTNVTEGDAYVIDGVLWIWNGESWISAGTIQGPQGPPGQDGIDGSDGVTPDWKTYVYKKSDSKPDAPTSTSIIPPGWEDYPTNDGQWWQCIGSVNGSTNQVTSWSEVLPVNGKDGVAQDGKYYEFRFALSSSNTSAPSISNTTREPSGWTIKPPTVTSGKYLWMTTAKINSDNTLIDTWSTPVCISGEKGETGSQGPAGNFTEYRFARNESWETAPTLAQTRNPSGWSTSIPSKTNGKVLWATFATINGTNNSLIGTWADPYYMTGVTGGEGASGIAGVGYEIRYCKGTETTYTGEAWNDTMKRKRNPDGWSLDVPELTNDDEYNYIWFIQVRIINDTLETGSYWSKPNPMGGVITPDPVTPNPIIYPAGIYRLDTPYINDGNTAPYVFDTSGDSNGNHYFLLNEIFPATNPWIGTQQNNKTPGQSNAWVAFENYEALYASVGIIGNALIGGAVFNNNLMFSQRGKNASDEDVSNYEDVNITPDLSNPDNVDTSHVMDTTNSFRPNFMLDFKNGEAYFGAGGIHLAANDNSSIQLKDTNNKLTLNKSGVKIERTGDSGSISLAPTIAKIDGDGLYTTSLNNNLLTNFQVDSNGISASTQSIGVITPGSSVNIQHLKCNIDGSGSLANESITWDSDGNLYSTVIYETINVSEEANTITLPELIVGVSKSYIITTPAYTRSYMGHTITGSVSSLLLYSYPTKVGSTANHTTYSSGATITLTASTVYCFTGLGQASGTSWKVVPLFNAG